MSKRQLLVATSNPGKVREFQHLLGDSIEVLSLSDLGLPSPEETGATFEENARIKAEVAAKMSGLIAVADDSGLVVDALGGEPGVFSARYAGEPLSDERNRLLVLERMAGVSAPARTARFRACVAVSGPDGLLAEATGTCEGAIAHEPRGTHGFGYDPIFLLADGRTMAELTRDEKGLISHRARAYQQLHHQLHDLLGLTMESPTS